MMNDIGKGIWDVLVTDVGGFVVAMKSLPKSTHIWAQLFPFPQFYFGAISAISIGPSSVGALYLYTRTISFIIAGQVHKRKPYSKLMGPIMHIPLFGAWAYGIDWLFVVDGCSNSTSSTEAIHCSFIVYTSVITGISLLLDLITTVKSMVGKDDNTVGSSKNQKRS